MNPTTEFSEAQRRLLSGPKSYFFEACMAEFEFLVSDHGFRRFIEDVGRNCYRVSFKQDRTEGYFTIRVYHDEDDMLWCDLERFAGEERKARLSSVCDVLGIACPPETLPHGSVRESVERCVRELAVIVRDHLSEIPSLIVSAPRKKEPNQSPEPTAPSGRGSS
jgi:hypothetical protein